MPRVATVQFQHRANDKDYNLSRMEAFAEQAAATGAKLVLTPEMAITGYWHVRLLTRAEIVALAEPVPAGPSVQRVAAMARRLQIGIGAGLIERSDDGRLFNTYVFCLPDGTVHAHRKLHTFVSEHLSSGENYTVFDTPWGFKAGILICWDNNLVENVRITALMGAEVLLAPHQTGGCRSRSPHAMGPIDPALWAARDTEPEPLRREFQGPKGREWLLRWLPARAHDNGLFLIFSNGVGQDDDEVRTGNAMVLDCYGRTLAESTALSDDLITADLDLSLLPLCTGRRWLRGRRPKLYGLLTQELGDELDPRAARFSDKPCK